MIVLDTNVVSELLRPVPEPRVEAWLARQDGASVYLTSISEAELRYGVALLPVGKRRKLLAEAIEAILQEDFKSRILSFDSAAASAYAAIAAHHRTMGRGIGQFDCQIAAIATIHDSAVATRNVDDFGSCGLEVIDPWAIEGTD